MLPLNPALALTFRPPVMEARRWLEGVSFPPERPLINVSQAAPVDPPPESLRRAIADASVNLAESHLYGPVLGRHGLRETLAQEWSRVYGGKIDAANVAITQGCNQAFCATLATLAGPGDEVILPAPWYFNHRMWLDMQGVRTVPLICSGDMVPDPQAAQALITPRTKAIVLVTPNNPTGAEYPAGIVRAFYDLARAHGIALILDETYRDFDSRDGAPHELLSDGDWSETLIQLYSFSKAYRLTGHRVGAVIAGPARMIEIEKFLDTVAICASQLGQIGAEWGMKNLGEWLAGERQEILRRRAAMEQGMARLPGWTLKCCGAYFAWVEHPFTLGSAELAQRLVREVGVLMLPGTMFMPDGASDAQRHARIAFANVDSDGISQLIDRLAAFQQE